jgi:hypothetical protein
MKRRKHSLIQERLQRVHDEDQPSLSEVGLAGDQLLTANLLAIGADQGGGANFLTGKLVLRPCAYRKPYPS